MNTKENVPGKEQVKAICLTLEHFLKDNDFPEDMKKVLEKRNPKYLNMLEIRKRDIDKEDHGIVIAGWELFFRFPE